MILNVYVYGLTAKSQTITTIYYQCREKRLTKDEEKHTWIKKIIKFCKQIRSMAIKLIKNFAGGQMK